MDKQAFIEVQNIRKTFQTQAQSVEVLKGVNLQIRQGEFVGIVGKSGSGKSTLLNMLTAIDKPTSGQVLVEGTCINQLNESEAAKWRGKNVGIVFQFFQLLPTLSVIDNIMLPMDFLNVIPGNQRKSRAQALLERVDMQAHAYKFPSALSGGEQQRVAIARALANDPALIVADEPTGNLDSETSKKIRRIFSELVQQGKTVLMVTHGDISDLNLHQVIRIADGQIVAHTQPIAKN
ncbi:MAG TPA: ABC transporter ATP-binding protein [Microscillaceae bacterium]|nr:ABC transporter ATP-binding protein [Microscillaceae bacterium]